ncbi:TPA: hypothetical protein QIU16_000549 [Citrobacter freundii]|nr:hypothetical protein [Citrobacter freundii]HEP1393926.1 hypothetical protein [Citrobacter freundii]
MTTNNHPANGPVSLDRLHQIREILSKAAAQRDGGNLGYAMADAVKVIDGAIAAFGDKPVAWRYRYVHTPKTEEHGSPFTTEWKLCDSEDECNPSDCFERQPLYTYPPTTVSVPDELTREEYRRRFMMEDNFDDTYRGGWNACRAAMLQAEPVIQPYKLPPNSFTDEDLEGMIHGNNPQSNAYRELLSFRRNSQWIGNDSTNGKPLTNGYIAANSPTTPDSELRDAVGGFLQLLDEYPEQLVPINRNASLVRFMRDALATVSEVNRGINS